MVYAGYSAGACVTGRCTTGTCSLPNLAAVDDHGVSDDKGCGVRRQPKDGGRDLLPRAHPPDRLLRDHLSRPPAVPPVNRCIISVSTMPGQTSLARMFDDA